MTYKETITWRTNSLNRRGTGTYWLLLGEDANRWHTSSEAITVTAKISMKDGSTHQFETRMLHLDRHGSDILGNDLSGPQKALVVPENIWEIYIAEVELERADAHKRGQGVGA